MKRRLRDSRSLLLAIIVPLALAGCATPSTRTLAETPVCGTIQHSPPYSGKKIEAAAGNSFKTWVATTNLTLDSLGCK